VEPVASVWRTRTALGGFWSRFWTSLQIIEQVQWLRDELRAASYERKMPLAGQAARAELQELGRKCSAQTPSWRSSAVASWLLLGANERAK